MVNASSGKKRIVVVGRNYGSNLSMIRSLKASKVKITVLHVIHSKKIKGIAARLLLPEIEKYSKYCSSFHVCITDKRPENIIKSLLKLKSDEKMLLIPTDDLAAGIIDEHYNELQGAYILPSVNKKGGEIIKLMSKSHQKEMAGGFGIKTAKSFIITPSNDGLINIPDDFKFPCFIKPNESRKSTKAVMKKCLSKEELKSVLNDLSKKDECEVLAEEFIDIKHEYSLLGISMDGVVFAPGLFMTENESIIDGVAIKGRLFDISNYADIKERLCLFVKSINYNGLFDIDLIEDKSGTIYFAEINLRFGGSGYAVTKGGVNLPSILADYVYKKKAIDTSTCVKGTGRTFVNESVIMNLYMKGKLSKENALKMMRDADIKFVYDEDDMKPYDKLIGFFLKGSIVRKILHA